MIGAGAAGAEVPPRSTVPVIGAVLVVVAAAAVVVRDRPRPWDEGRRRRAVVVLLFNRRRRRRRPLTHTRLAKARLAIIIGSTRLASNARAALGISPVFGRHPQGPSQGPRAARRRASSVVSRSLCSVACVASQITWGLQSWQKNRALVSLHAASSEYRDASQRRAASAELTQANRKPLQQRARSDDKNCNKTALSAAHLHRKHSKRQRPQFNQKNAVFAATLLTQNSTSGPSIFYTSGEQRGNLGARLSSSVGGRESGILQTQAK